MKHTHLIKNKIKFVNGKISAPSDDDPLFDAWEHFTNVVMAWISSSLAPDIAQSMIYINNDVNLWTYLANCFSKDDHFCISDLLQQIHSIHQGEKIVTTYFNDLKTLWEDFKSLRPLPICICGVSLNFKKQREMEYVICFFKGFNDNFTNVKSNILMTNPLSDVAKIFSLVLQQER